MSVYYDKKCGEDIKTLIDSFRRLWTCWWPCQSYWICSHGDLHDYDHLFYAFREKGRQFWGYKIIFTWILSLPIHGHLKEITLNISGLLLHSPSLCAILCPAHSSRTWLLEMGYWATFLVRNWEIVQVSLTLCWTRLQPYCWCWCFAIKVIAFFSKFLQHLALLHLFNLGWQIWLFNVQTVSNFALETGFLFVYLK